MQVCPNTFVTPTRMFERSSYKAFCLDLIGQNALSTYHQQTHQGTAYSIDQLNKAVTKDKSVAEISALLNESYNLSGMYASAKVATRFDHKTGSRLLV